MANINRATEEKPFFKIKLMKQIPDTNSAFNFLIFLSFVEFANSATRKKSFMAKRLVKKRKTVTKPKIFTSGKLKLAAFVNSDKLKNKKNTSKDLPLPISLRVKVSSRFF
ncbi:MAG: hypothetical protein ACQETH_16775 [Candidatus Rifleibacteriota bacterium]